jgi:hypothetical protein
MSRAGEDLAGIDDEVQALKGEIAAPNAGPENPE